jgi:hydrogenase-4 component B
MPVAEIALALGGGLVVLAGLAGVSSWRGGASLAAQALGMAILGVAGIVVAAQDSSVGSAFHSDLRPALGIDRLSAIFLAALAMVAVPALVYARGYLASSRTRQSISVLTSAFLLALVLVLLARDVTTLLAGWELMTLLPAAAILVARGTEAPVRRAVFVYLAVTHVGGAGTWVALLTLAQHGAIGGTGAPLAPDVATVVAIAAIVGFGTKAGLMPLHTWLPLAHPVAPAHLSALMSGMMIKIALYGLVRVLFEWLGPLPLWVGLVVLAMGAASAVGGVLYALVQHELKRLLAFHSIENVGIIALALGAALVFRNRGSEAWAAIALGAALLHTINHAAFKALLFLGAGAFERAAGSLELDQLGGLLRRMPWTGGMFLLGSAAIAGVPPLNGFVSEWLVLQSLVHMAFDQPVGIAIAGAVAVAGLAATAALALYCFVKVVGLVLLGPARTRATADAVECGPAMRAGMAVLALACVGLAAVPGVLLPALAGAVGDEAELPVRAGLDVPGSGGLPTLAVIVTFAALVALVSVARGSRRAARAPAWACGQRPAPQLGWTSAGFTKPLRLVLESVLRTEREITRTESGGVLRRVEYRATVPHLFDTLLYEPAARAALRAAGGARRLQSGSVRTYAGYLLGLLVIALLAAHWGVLS